MFVRTTESGDVMLIVCFFHEDVEKRTALLDAVAAMFPQVKSRERVSGASATSPSCWDGSAPATASR